MNRNGSGRSFALALLIAMILVPAAATVCFAQAVGGGGVDQPTQPQQVNPGDIQPETMGMEPKAAVVEATRVSGTIYKVDPTERLVGILVPPSGKKRAYRRVKLYLDEKSLILVAGQPSGIDALESGQIVEAGFFKKGKQEILDTLTVVPAQ